jgi:hypothetical protein
MQIVLDTNIIFDHWQLDGPNFLVLEKLIRLSKCKLIIPEIVFMEVINKYRQELLDCTKAIDDLNKLIPNEEKRIQYPNIDQLCKEYEDSLIRKLEGLQAERPSHTDIPHDDIISRSLTRRRPFSKSEKSDKGYRDTLLWEVILRKVAKTDIITFFITNNTTDFGTSSNEHQFHSDLLEDIRSHGLPEGSVRLYTNLKQWVSDNGLPCLEEFAREVAEKLKDGEYKSFSLLTWFNSNREHFLTALNEQIQEILSTWYELEDPTVAYIEDLETINIEEIATIDESTVYITAEALAEVSVDALIYQWDYDPLSRKYPIVLADSDWSESYVFAAMLMTLPIKFSAIFDIIGEKISSFEIDNIEIFGWCRHCGATILSDAAEGCYKCGKQFW